MKSKLKKSLVFAELMYDLPSLDVESTSEDSILDESLFSILSSDPWYGYFLIYL